MSASRATDALADARRAHARQLEDTLALAAIPAPTGDEQARLDWLRRRLAAAPGRLHDDPAGNLVWRWGDEQAPPRTLVLAHVDTVFGAEVPHDARLEDGVLIGPGVGDNACAVATAIAAVEALHRAGPVAPGAVAFTVAEEGLGNLAGARRACADLRPDCAIAVEGHGLDRLIVDAVGSVRARLSLSGPGGHSWWDRGTPSAIAGLVALLASLAPDGDDTAFNVGTVAGGSTVNAIAASATAMVEARSLDGAALEAFADRLLRLAAPDGLELAVDIVGKRPAGRLDRSSALLRAARDARALLELPDVLGDGSTDANAALALGIPALCLGCADGSGMHTPGERIDAASLVHGHAQLRLVLAAVLSVAPGPAGPSPSDHPSAGAQA